MSEVTDLIKRAIEKLLDQNIKSIIIYPYGEIGMEVKNILNNAYGIEEAFIVDNRLCKYNSKIQSSALFEKISCSDYGIILSTLQMSLYESLFKNVSKYFPSDHIVVTQWHITPENIYTKVGKYSYGPICTDHPLIESIGAFCSFALGVDAVENHEMRYVSTHTIIYRDIQDKPFAFDGIRPKVELCKQYTPSRIGNDVWLGKNVIITNGANIGNGVIAGAGSIITKDIPDYAVVVGAPARIIRYRYTPQQIEALNRIAWWDWSDNEIRERHDDFYLPIDDFIRKYAK
nr:CatB-related O-acetyltransferase [uncultured Agathobaculum sp.]